MAQFIRRTKPDRLILEPSGASHPAKVVDVLRSPNFSSVIDLRNTICLIDPKDFDDPRWRETEVFQNQIQLADFVVINWTDKRDRALIDRCREWVESFVPTKLVITESSFGDIDPAWLDAVTSSVRVPAFPDAHPIARNARNTPATILGELPLLITHSAMVNSKNPSAPATGTECAMVVPTPGRPLRVSNNELGHDACGWIFHVDDIFDRDTLLDLLGYVHPILRLKGVFRCEDNWWSINRTKDTTSYAPSAYRRDSRLEIILDQPTSGWIEFEHKLLGCLLQSVTCSAKISVTL